MSFVDLTVLKESLLNPLQRDVAYYAIAERAECNIAGRLSKFSVLRLGKCIIYAINFSIQRL